MLAVADGDAAVHPLVASSKAALANAPAKRVVARAVGITCWSVRAGCGISGPAARVVQLGGGEPLEAAVAARDQYRALA